MHTSSPARPPDTSINPRNYTSRDVYTDIKNTRILHMSMTTTTTPLMTMANLAHLMDLVEDWSLIPDPPTYRDGSGQGGDDDDDDGGGGVASRTTTATTTTAATTRRRRAPRIKPSVKRPRPGGGGVGGQCRRLTKKTRTTVPGDAVVAGHDGDDDDAADDDDDDNDENDATMEKVHDDNDPQDTGCTVDTLSPHAQRVYAEFQRFFDGTDLPHELIEPMIQKQEEANPMYSGRLLLYFITNFVKDHDARYFLLLDKDDDEDGHGDDDEGGKRRWRRRGAQYYATLDDLRRAARDQGRVLKPDDWLDVDLQSEYATMIRRHQTVCFGLFRRGRRIQFRYRNSRGEDAVLVTTFCQLTFFWWASCIQLPTYWARHFERVRATERQNKTNARNKHPVLFSHAYTMDQTFPGPRSLASQGVVDVVDPPEPEPLDPTTLVQIQYPPCIFPDVPLALTSCL